MTDTKTAQVTDADSALAAAQQLLNDVTSGRWVTGRLKAGGPITPPMEEAAKPIHQLEAAGFGWFVPKVQPLQAAVDRMAVDARWAQTYIDTWQRTSDKINEIGKLLDQYSSSDTTKWQGLAALRYRDRAAEIATALEALDTVDKAKAEAAEELAQVASDAYRQSGQLLTSLVQQLISSLSLAQATSGGMTAQAMADATNLVSSCAARIADVERELIGSVNNLIEGTYTSGQINPVVTDSQAVGALGIWGQIYKAIAAAFGGKTDDELPEPIVPMTAGAAGITAAAKKKWPNRKDYKSATGYGRDWHQAMAELERAHEGKYLINGWRVDKIERTLGGKKRVDFMMVNDTTKEIQVVDYYTGKVEPRSHIDKSWSYQNEPYIQDLKAKGYTYRAPATGYTDVLH